MLLGGRRHDGRDGEGKTGIRLSAEARKQPCGKPAAYHAALPAKVALPTKPSKFPNRSYATWPDTLRLVFDVLQRNVQLVGCSLSGLEFSGKSAACSLDPGRPRGLRARAAEAGFQGARGQR